MEHILQVAEEIDNKKKELQEDMMYDEFGGYKFNSKKLN